MLLKTAIADFAHFIFPRLCAGCGNDTVSDLTPLCWRCIDRMPVTNFNRYAGNPVEKIFWGRIDISAAASLLEFTDGSVVQRILHEIKYRGNKDLGYFMGRLMALFLMKSPRFSAVDALVPLPLFASRETTRGYNQATLLCNGLASVTSLPVVDKAVRRVQATATQTHKSRVDRWMNMDGKFMVMDQKLLAGRHLLLVDDVLTTGASLEACGSILLSAKPASLSIASLAYTV